MRVLRHLRFSNLVHRFVYFLVQGDSGGPMHINNNSAYHIVGEYLSGADRTVSFADGQNGFRSKADLREGLGDSS